MVGLGVGVDEPTIVALRQAGWTVGQIVTETGAEPAMVARALGARGALPASWTAPTVARAVTWSQQRRAGQRVADIAARAGVSHQWVSRLTGPFGPFPPAAADDVPEWVQARRAGDTLDSIARRFGVSAHRVSAATAAHGPFAYPQRDHGGRVGTAGMARMLGVAEPTVTRWQRRVDFPPPALEGNPGRAMWDREAVQAWAAQALTRCPVCAAQVLDLPRHRGARRH